MIKCPRCGSSAQVKLNPTAVVSSNQEVLTLGCECGCGCHFTVDYYTDEYFWCEEVYYTNNEEE